MAKVDDLAIPLWNEGFTGTKSLIIYSGSDYCRTDTSYAYINCTTGRLFGAKWNDFAEYRKCNSNVIPGNVVVESDNDELTISTKRLQPVGYVVSDTFGFSIGKTEETTTPVASCGRVLAIPYEDRNSYNVGDYVCSAPDGKVSKMTAEEIRKYPQCIIGYVVSVPSYEIWSVNNIQVNNRIWIQVK